MYNTEENPPSLTNTSSSSSFVKINLLPQSEATTKRLTRQRAEALMHISHAVGFDVKREK